MLAATAAAIPRPLAAAAARLSGFEIPGLLARALTLVSANELVLAKARDFAAISNSADLVIAVCAWLERALAINGLDNSRLVLSRQGIDADLAAKLTALGTSRGQAADPVTFGLIGRWHKTKGIDLAIRAFRKLDSAAGARLAIYATAQGLEGESYREQCLAMIGGDERISVHPAFARSDLPDILTGMDALLVPSRWLETGPLVALEALAAGVWVIGSNIGGLPELITEGQTGMLVPVDEDASWTQAMSNFVRDPKRPLQFKPRTMSDVASDMVEVYARLPKKRVSVSQAVV